MRKRRFRHRAPKSLVFPSILLPKSVPSPPFCIPNRSLPLDFAPQMPQAPTLSIFDRFPCQNLVQNGSLFGRFPDIFAYLLKKCDLSKTCTGVSGLHVRPSPGAPFSPNLSSKSSVLTRARNFMPNGDAWSAGGGGGGLPLEREKQPPDLPSPPTPQTHQTC